jgi:hypothetical protein
MQLNQIRTLQLLPPSPDKCPCCAVAHPPEQAHDATSMFFAFWFQENHGRSPTWNDAIAHCPPEIKTSWTQHLLKMGIDPGSTDKRGGISTQADLDRRLANPRPITDAVLGGNGCPDADAAILGGRDR